MASTALTQHAPTMEPLGYVIDLSHPFEIALAATKEALKAEGFGIVSEIDLQGTFREKLGRAFRPYTILGACNPHLAITAVTAEPAVGLLLPCNVTVEALDLGRSRVRLADPREMLAGVPWGDTPAMQSLAQDAHARIERVVVALRNPELT